MPCDGKGLTRVYKSGSIYVRLNDDSLGSKKVCDGELSTIQHRIEAQCRKYIRFREGGWWIIFKWTKAPRFSLMQRRVPYIVTAICELAYHCYDMFYQGKHPIRQPLSTTSPVPCSPVNLILLNS